MAPNSDIIRFSPTPAFAARMLALPVLSDAVHRALDVFDSTKNRNDAMGAALRAAEASMRVAASGALPLATPIVNSVGGWGVVDEWACRGLDRVEKVAPIIKKPGKEIVMTTRQTMLKALAGETKAVPESFSDAFTVRASNTADFVVNTRGGKVVVNAADQMLNSAHTLVDNYLPPQKGDRQGKGIPNGDVTIKVTSLFNKAQQRLYRSVYVFVRAPNDSSLDGTVTLALLIDFGRRSTTDLYQEVLREPRQGEVQNMAMALVRSTVKRTRQFYDQFPEILQRTLESLKTMDREALVKNLQSLLQSTMDLLASAGVYFQSGTSSVGKLVGNAMQNAGQLKDYLENLLRKAMSDYEQRERAARAAAAAASWREKNQMQRVASPPPVEPLPPQPAAVAPKSKTSGWQKKMMGK